MDANALQDADQAERFEPCRVEADSATPNWDEFLARHAGATVYHDPRWGGVMAEAYGNRPTYLTARRQGRVVGVLPLVRQKSLLFGKSLCSVPYFDAAGVLADDAAAADALVDRARSLLADGRLGWVELRQLEPLADSLPTRTDKVTLWLSLPAGAEAMWNQLKTKVRTKVRKTQKNDLQSADGGAELLDEYFDVYSRTMRDLGSPSHSRRFFRLALEAFADQVRLFVVRHQGRTLAAAFTLTDKQGFHVPWSGSDVRHRRLGANRLMYWTMLEHAAQAEAPRFDFGRSTKDSGTYGFKKEWGAEEVGLYWHYLVPEGQAPPELRPDSAKFRLMVTCWKKLPLWLARALGPRIIAKLP